MQLSATYLFAISNLLYEDGGYPVVSQPDIGSYGHLPQHGSALVYSSISHSKGLYWGNIDKSIA